MTREGVGGIPNPLLPALSLLQALGIPHPSLFPPTQLVFPDGLPVGPACLMAQAPMAKTDASSIPEGTGTCPPAPKAGWGVAENRRWRLGGWG